MHKSIVALKRSYFAASGAWSCAGLSPHHTYQLYEGEKRPDRNDDSDGERPCTPHQTRVERANLHLSEAKPAAFGDQGAVPIPAIANSAMPTHGTQITRHRAQPNWVCAQISS